MAVGQGSSSGQGVKLLYIRDYLMFSDCPRNTIFERIMRVHHFIEFCKKGCTQIKL